jgi:hypothetical protein
MQVPNTNGWETFQPVTKAGVILSGGQHVLRLALDSNGTQQFPAVANFNYLKFVAR